MFLLNEWSQYYSKFTDEKTEVYRSSVNVPTVIQLKVAELKWRWLDNIQNQSVFTRAARRVFLEYRSNENNPSYKPLPEI